jgi:hypothetical protein
MRTSVNPFHKMSFETSTDFLRQATLEGDHDSVMVCFAVLLSWVDGYGVRGAVVVCFSFLLLSFF